MISYDFKELANIAPFQKKLILKTPANFRAFIGSSWSDAHQTKEKESRHDFVEITEKKEDTKKGDPAGGEGACGHRLGRPEGCDYALGPPACLQPARGGGSVKIKLKIKSKIKSNIELKK